ncbi:MAG: helix-turn-helix transcriptional regulator [Lysobacter sp.]
MSRRLIRLPEVIARTGISRSTIYQRAKDGTFPKPVPLGNSLSAWVADEVDAWIDARIKARDGAPSLASNDEPDLERAA